MAADLRNTVPARAATLQTKRNVGHKFKKATGAEAQVIVPATVDIPLSKPVVQQIAVPASINGRDLSDGKI